MANPICFSPLNFYDDAAKQCHRRSYAYNSVSPLIARRGFLPCFQFVIPTDLYGVDNDMAVAYIRDVEGNRVTENIASALLENGFAISDINGFKVAVYDGLLPISFNKEGMFYLEIGSANDEWRYYSEVFCFKSNVDDCMEIEYWNGGNNNFYVKDGIIAFPGNFHFRLLVPSELGKPEYSFEEESTKRMGYNFIESQVSKKTYKFSFIAPEFICDAMRIIRLCSDRIIKTAQGDHKALTFEMEVEWQEQGDLALVKCEFDVDNIIANLGGFVSPLLGGDYNGDYNNDFNNQ